MVDLALLFGFTLASLARVKLAVQGTEYYYSL